MVFEYTQLQYGKQPPSKNENVISESCVFMAAFLLFRFLEEIIFFLRSTLRPVTRFIIIRQMSPLAAGQFWRVAYPRPIEK